MRDISQTLGASIILLCILAGIGWAEVTESMSEIKADERVVFFPTAAKLSDDGRSWIVPIHGWIFEPEEHDWWRAPLVRELRRLVDLTETEPVPEVFEQRVLAFLVDNERGKRIAIRIAGREHLLPLSSPNGHFADKIELPVDAVNLDTPHSRIEFRALTSSGDDRTFAGVVHCILPEGISVVSDIDDTIKIADVRNKRELMRNTFLREFRAVDQMAAAYQRWAAEGADFHYVSSSPWQLYEPLAEFIRSTEFPDGTFHFKTFRVKDSTAFDLFADPTSHKQSVLEELLASFPKRTFILVGDSGEKDPEIYGRLARNFPKQIRGIYIRDVTGEPASAARYREAFSDVPAEVWDVFDDPATLPPLREELSNGEKTQR